MAIALYPAIVEQAGDGYSVFFPDLPGCVSAGTTLQNVALNAEDALAGHLLVSAQHGDELPDPTPLDRLEVDPEVKIVHVGDPRRQISAIVRVGSSALSGRAVMSV